MSADTKIQQHQPFAWESEEQRLTVLQETIARANADLPENQPLPSRLPAPIAPPPPTAPSSGVFTEEDLFSLAHRTQRVPMPGGKHVYIHTLSLEEVGWVNAQAFAYVQRKGTLTEDERRLWYALAVKLFQTIVCARTSEQPDAPPVFTVKNHEAVARNLGWAKVEQMGNLSDALGLESGEQELVTDFFGLVARFSQTMCARLTSGSPASCLPAMQEFASLATSVTQRGYLLPSDLDALNIALAALEGTDGSRH